MFGCGRDCVLRWSAKPEKGFNCLLVIGKAEVFFIDLNFPLSKMDKVSLDYSFSFFCLYIYI